MVASETAVLLFSSNVKIKKVSKKMIPVCIKIFAKYFKGLAVFSIHKRAPSIF